MEGWRDGWMSLRARDGASLQNRRADAMRCDADAAAAAAARLLTCGLVWLVWYMTSPRSKGSRPGMA